MSLHVHLHKTSAHQKWQGGESPLGAFTHKLKYPFKCMLPRENVAD